MKEELEKIFLQIKKASDIEQIKLFLLYCSKLVEYKEKGEISMEGAASRMCECDQIATLSKTELFQKISKLAQVVKVVGGSLYNSRTNSALKEKIGEEEKRKSWFKIIVLVERALHTFRTKE